ncbi:HI1506-related protein [Limnobaculum xujianqingii]|uniref:HI1506-related protein n=1 Tax=Limnobaculum xujianqingii TaxID=2738837 RepID=UPI00112D470B|nr:HI1506-related protein [Limnobaculum xujianqingii]
MQENQETYDPSDVVEMSGVMVVNTAHDGYRRAGFSFKSGENILPPVTAAQWHLLDGDPRLVVSVIATESAPGHQTPGAVDDNAISVRVDMPGIVNTPMPPELAPTEGSQVNPQDNFISAILASKIEPYDKWFTQKGEPRLTQWRDVIGVDVSAEDIKAAIAAHDTLSPTTEG